MSTPVVKFCRLCGSYYTDAKQHLASTHPGLGDGTLDVQEAGTGPTAEAAPPPAPAGVVLTDVPVAPAPQG